MSLTLLAICTLLVGPFLVDVLWRFFRLRTLERRADQICGTGVKTAADEPKEVPTGFVRLLERWGFDMTAQGMSVYLALLSLPLIVALIFVGWRTGVILVVMITAGYAAFARWRGSRRTREFADRLPAFLERTRRLVLVGNTLSQAFVVAVANGDTVIKRELEPLVRRVWHGASFPDSVDMLARHNDIVELHMLAAYVRSNAKYGGRVAQTLSNLVGQLANKQRLDREIRASTAETRASAAILCGLMVFVVVLMSVINPDYVSFFFGSRNGRLIFLAIIAWPGIGILAIRRILAVDF